MWRLLYELKATPMPYVSRGGLKLEKAIKSFHLDFKDKTVLDIGVLREDLRIVLSSTGLISFIPVMWDIISWPGACVIMKK